MGRRPHRHFSQRGHAGGQKAHEKMLNIANNQGNTNANHKDMSPPTRMFSSKRKQILAHMRKGNPPT